MTDAIFEPGSPYPMDVRMMRVETMLVTTARLTDQNAKAIDRMEKGRPSRSDATIIALLTTAVGVLSTLVAVRL